VITALIIAAIWIALGIGIMELAIRFDPSWPEDPLFKAIVIGTVLLWPFSLAVVIYRKIRGKL